MGSSDGKDLAVQNQPAPGQARRTAVSPSSLLTGLILGLLLAGAMYMVARPAVVSAAAAAIRYFSMEEQYPGQLCEQVVAESLERYEWAPREGWLVQCVDEISGLRTRYDMSTGFTFYGATTKGSKVISISRATPADTLRNVVAHEFVHAYASDVLGVDADGRADPGTPGGKRWAAWLQLIAPRSEAGNHPYLEDPEELLAVSAAKCWTGPKAAVNAEFGFVSCARLFDLFPELAAGWQGEPEPVLRTVAGGVLSWEQ